MIKGQYISLRCEREETRTCGAAEGDQTIATSMLWIQAMLPIKKIVEEKRKIGNRH